MPIDTRHPRDIRQDIRRGKLAGITAGLGQNYVQANLAVLPKEQAYDFLLFCQRNPRPCPLIEVTDVGSAEPVGVAPGADLRTDIPRYRVYKDGVLADEVTDATPYWRDDLVAFLLGCSFTFEWALLEAGIRLWHVEHGKNVAMWRTSTQCRPAGVFHGPMVVSMRPIAAAQLAKAVTASARFPGAHGAPVHVGDPAAIGITDIARPDWGDPQEFARGDVPVFWACGVTPQAVALASRPPFMITHSPGHMFTTVLPPARTIELPCCYDDPELGFDLEAAAKRLALSTDELVGLHAGAEYLVYFIGFTPGLPYMMGMPERINIPRLDTPRTKTPPGSVGIGGIQCCIYSVESPGGFWILGRTPLALYAPDAAEPTLLRPGDRVPFRRT